MEAGGRAADRQAGRESDRCPQLTTDHLCMRKMEMGSIAFRRREKVRASEVCAGGKDGGSKISRRERDGGGKARGNMKVGRV